MPELGENMRPVQSLLPIHAIMPLYDDISALLPHDYSPMLKDILEAASPTKSLEDLHNELGITYNVLQRAATHLEFWKVAMVITKVGSRSLFVVSPEIDLIQAASEGADLTQLTKFCVPTTIKSIDVPQEL
jgi:hypothetical protein